MLKNLTIILSFITWLFIAGIASDAIAGEYVNKSAAAFVIKPKANQYLKAPHYPSLSKKDKIKLTYDNTVNLIDR